MDDSFSTLFGLLLGVLGALISAIGLAVTVAIAMVQSRQSRKLQSTVDTTQAIATRQDKQSHQLGKLLQQVHEVAEETREIVRRGERAEAVAEAAEIEADSDPSDAYQGDQPDMAEALIELLNRHEKAQLDPTQVTWERKTSETGDQRGNRGWFVSPISEDRNDRWFVHRGVKEKVRPAVPKDFLEAWTTTTGLSPRNIRLDYRTTENTNAAWYVETYDGRTWKLSKGGRGARDTIHVTQL
ncbi:hypothetical protein [Leucobacter sp. NPDC077196]|uniref:hypothetical protein n=1 Tax=Leucobacter sp. NPDC077196 TaxID=3154959 RepID=UPI00342BB51B